MLCVFRLLFHLCNFRFHGFDQHCELFLAYLSCLCVQVPLDAFAVDSRREPTLVEVVVYHGDASRATLAYLAHTACALWYITRHVGVGGKHKACIDSPGMQNGKNKKFNVYANIREEGKMEFTKVIK